MKFHRYQCLIFLIVLSCSCSKDSDSIHYGTASAVVNGVQWQTNKVRCGYLECRDGRLFIELTTYNNEGFLRETYSFMKFVTDSALIQQLYSSTNDFCSNDTLESTYYTSEDDGDPIKSFYQLKNNRGSYLKIDSYDPASKKITGSFEATYIIDSNYIDSGSIDSIRITNGKFSTKFCFEDKCKANILLLIELFKRSKKCN